MAQIVNFPTVENSKRGKNFQVILLQDVILSKYNENYYEGEFKDRNLDFTISLKENNVMLKFYNSRIKDNKNAKLAEFACTSLLHAISVLKAYVGV